MPIYLRLHNKTNPTDGISYLTHFAPIKKKKKKMVVIKTLDKWCSHLDSVHFSTRYAWFLYGSSMNKQDFQFYYNVTAHEMDTFNLITKTFDDSYRIKKKSTFLFFLILRIKRRRKNIQFSIPRWVAFLKLLCLFKAHYMLSISPKHAQNQISITKLKKLYHFE